MRLPCIQFPNRVRGQVHDVPVRDVYRSPLAKTANIEPARLSRINTRRPRHSETLPPPAPAPPPPPPPPSPPLPPTTPLPVHSCFHQPPPSSIRTDTTTPRHAGSRLFRDFLADSSTSGPSIPFVVARRAIASCPSHPRSSSVVSIHPFSSIQRNRNPERKKKKKTRRPSIRRPDSRSTRNRWYTADDSILARLKLAEKPDDRGFFSLLGICRFHFR